MHTMDSLNLASSKDAQVLLLLSSSHEQGTRTAQCKGDSHHAAQESHPSGLRADWLNWLRVIQPGSVGYHTWGTTHQAITGMASHS